MCKSHEATHFEKKALATLVLSQVYIDGIHQLTAAASAKCLSCAKNNARQGPTGPPGVQRAGIAPFQCITTDFTEMPKCQGYKYMLVFINTYSNWPEALPCRTEQAKEVAKGLLRCILPSYGFPEQIGSDNGPAFIQEAVQILAKSLGIDWSLHCAYRPESSGKSERVNRCIKAHLSKLCQETGLKWVDLLPLALFRIRCTPRGALKLSPYKMLFGRPPPIIRPEPETVKELGQLQLKKTVQGLGTVIQEIQRYVISERPLPVTHVHPFSPGDWVWLKDWKTETLQPR